VGLRIGTNSKIKPPSHQIKPVAKPLVLQLARGTKLRPTEVGFGATPYESINCRKLAEDGENEDG
jgi:hypothetical protein